MPITGLLQVKLDLACSPPCFNPWHCTWFLEHFKTEQRAKTGQSWVYHKNKTKKSKVLHINLFNCSFSYTENTIPSNAHFKLRRGEMRGPKGLRYFFISQI